MTASIITVLALVAGITWLGLMIVSALRNRGGEEISANLKPGIDDQHLETRRLEGGQKAAIAFSAFLAVSLPLYFLGENSRQAGFVAEFDEASVARGAHIVEEFRCFSCHGPLGSGGSASYVEKRSGVTVSWTAPSLDDVFLRYDDDEVTFWVTFGRGNTPMPAWGLAGGGPMNVNQVQDVVHYLHTIQQPQQEVANRTTDKVKNALGTLTGADDTIAGAILQQEQVVADIDQAAGDAEFVVPLADEAKETLDGAGTGIDTDADGLSDTAESKLSELSRQAVEFFRAVEPIQLDPETPDAEKADEIVAALTAGQETDPILSRYLAAVQDILANPDEGDDTDGDGIPDADERAISGQMTEAAESTVPGLTSVTLDPTNPQSVSGTADHATATTLVGSLESAAINKRVLHENEERIRPQEEGGLAFLEQSQQNQTWEIDIPGVAESMGVSLEEAERAVGLFNGYCARCHTAGFSAGVPYTLEAGSGGFGPALWDGRPVVQFGEAPEAGSEDVDLLVEFLIRGSEAQKPYGLNGFGSGRMPAFGAVLSEDDLHLLARYLRSANMDGMHEVTHVLP